MSNGNQQRCCILGVCCPPGGAAQIAALAEYLETNAGPKTEGTDSETRSAEFYRAASALLRDFKIRSE